MNDDDFRRLVSMECAEVGKLLAHVSARLAAEDDPAMAATCRRASKAMLRLAFHAAGVMPPETLFPTGHYPRSDDDL